MKIADKRKDVRRPGARFPTGRTRRRTITGAALGLLIGSAVTDVSAQMSGSLEDGLQQLAEQIVEQSQAADRRTIAVLPFPHADGGCSVVSTYLVDELILNLFSIPNSTLEIVERSQLEALLSELELGEGGLLDPATTRQLGSVSGVDALTVGTITIIGDAVRVNARLVSTETARTVSAAAVTIPRTAALNELLDQPVTVGPTCGRPMSAGSNGRVSPRPPEERLGVVEGAGVQIELRSFSRDDDGLMRANITLTNTNSQPVAVGFVKPAPSLLSSGGDHTFMTSIVGINYCRNEILHWCSSLDQQEITILQESIPYPGTISFGDSMNLYGESLNLSFRMIVWIENEHQIFDFVIPNLPNLTN